MCFSDEEMGIQRGDGTPLRAQDERGTHTTVFTRFVLGECPPSSRGCALNTFPTFITALLHLQMILRDRTSKEAPIPRLSSWVEMGIPHEGLCGEGQPARRWTEVAGIPVLSFPGCVTLL